MARDQIRTRPGSKWTPAQLEDAIRELKRHGIMAVIRDGILVDGSSLAELRRMPVQEKLRRTSLMMQVLPRPDETPEEIAEVAKARARWVKLIEAFERRGRLRRVKSSRKFSIDRRTPKSSRT